jgi:hypothetical protein
MIELIALFALCRSLGHRLRAKGIAPLWMQFGWFVGVAVVMICFGQEVVFASDTYIGVYLIALVGACCAAAIAYIGGLSLPSQTPQQIRRPG